MFATNAGDMVLPTSADGTGLYASATVASAGGTVYLKLVNPSASTQLARLRFGLPGAAQAGIQVLGGPGPNAGNTLANPGNITPAAPRSTPRTAPSPTSSRPARSRW